jgi:ubiquinone/menaquinone biosynthesis C-methylase UbiE
VIEYQSLDALNVRIQTHRELSAEPDDVEAEVQAIVRPHLQTALLDAGCGTGTFLARLRTLSGRWRLEGVDTSAAAVDQVNEQGHATARLADVANLPHPAADFDVTTARHMLYHVADPVAALRELARVTRPGGVVVATVNHRHGLPRVVELVTTELEEAGVEVRSSASSSDSDRLPEQLEQGGLTDVRLRRHDNALVFPAPEPLVRFAVAILGVYGLTPDHPSHHAVVASITRRATGWFRSNGGPWVDPKGYTIAWGSPPAQ